MAKNWTVAEVVVELKQGNKESIIDIGKRFPLVANVVARSLAGDADAVVEMLQALPEYNTAGKMNKALQMDLEDTKDEDEEDVEENKKETKKSNKKESEDKEVKKETSDDKDYEKMGAYPLYKLCKERGLDVKSKRPKEDYIKALLEADGAETESEDVEETEAAEGYGSMSAQELFKECKARGLKVEPKKPSKYYIAKLEEDDEAVDNDEDDEWEDEKPAKQPKESKKSKAKEKEVVEDEDDDDDWEI